MTKARHLLALDAAGAACSVALWREGTIVARRLETMRRGQSERLVPMLQETMAEAGTTFSSLDAIAATVGPGGFTGVRIGLAAARGLSLAWGLPLIGITNFEAVAAAAAGTGDGRLLVLLDAKRAEVYAQLFAPDGQAIGDPALIAPQALDRWLPPGPVLLAGDGLEQARAALRTSGRLLREAETAGLTDAAWVARLAATRPLPTAGAPPPAPLYLRQADVTLPGGASGQTAP